MANELQTLASQWKAMFENCKLENGIFVDCEIDVEKIKREFKEHETVLRNKFSLGLFQLNLEKFNELLRKLESLQTKIDSIKESKEKIKAESSKVTF